jgi:hypothetical protein
MIRTLATRLAIAESRAWLRSFQQAIEQSFLEAADEAGVSLATREGVLAALQAAHRAYPTPPPGWHDDYEEALVVADVHTKQAREILGRSLADLTVLRAICRGMVDRLTRRAKGADDATT